MKGILSTCCKNICNLCFKMLFIAVFYCDVKLSEFYLMCLFNVCIITCCFISLLKLCSRVGEPTKQHPVIKLHKLYANVA